MEASLGFGQLEVGLVEMNFHVLDLLTRNWIGPRDFKGPNNLRNYSNGNKTKIIILVLRSKILKAYNAK